MKLEALRAADLKKSIRIFLSNNLTRKPKLPFIEKNMKHSEVNNNMHWYRQLNDLTKDVSTIQRKYDLLSRWNFNELDCLPFPKWVFMLIYLAVPVRLLCSRYGMCLFVSKSIYSLAKPKSEIETLQRLKQKY